MKFIDKHNLTKEQLTDPDYRLKMIQEMFGREIPVSCSKCHHCR